MMIIAFFRTVVEILIILPVVGILAMVGIFTFD